MGQPDMFIEKMGLTVQTVKSWKVKKIDSIIVATSEPCIRCNRTQNKTIVRLQRRQNESENYRW